MGLLGRRDDGQGTGTAVEADEDVYVVSRKAAGHAVKAEKEKRRAARADRKLAEAMQSDHRKQRIDLTSADVPDTAAAEVADLAAELGPKDSKKAAKKAAKAAEKEAKKKGEKGPEPVTGSTVKRYIGIAKVVVPVAAPLIYQAVGEARSRWDDHKARRLGVPPDQLADFSGRGAALYARLHHLAMSVRELGTRRKDDRETAAFVEDAQARLADLEAAVRSAEQMPSSRRRNAHAAVSDELDRLETRLLAFWGVDGTQRAPGQLPSGGTGAGTTPASR